VLSESILFDQEFSPTSHSESRIAKKEAFCLYLQSRLTEGGTRRCWSGDCCSSSLLAGTSDCCLFEQDPDNKDNCYVEVDIVEVDVEYDSQHCGIEIVKILLVWEDIGRISTTPIPQCSLLYSTSILTISIY
jgi:hypothetical protein